MNLQGKTAVVTGAAVRLGRACALALAEAGCHLCLHYRSSAEEAEATARQVADFGGQACTVQADFSEPETAAKTVISAARTLPGEVAVLVNSAALFEPGSLVSTTASQWRRHFAVNLETPVFLCREFVRQQPAGAEGHIVNIADWRGTHPVPGHLAYTLTKSALVALTRLLAQELAPAVRVNAIAPGAILPPAEGNPGDGRGNHATFQQLARQIPLRQTGKPADVTETLLFLLRSDFITGEVIHITGGQQWARCFSGEPPA